VCQAINPSGSITTRLGTTCCACVAAISFTFEFDTATMYTFDQQAFVDSLVSNQLLKLTADQIQVKDFTWKIAQEFQSINDPGVRMDGRVNTVIQPVQKKNDTCLVDIKPASKPQVDYFTAEEGQLIVGVLSSATSTDTSARNLTMSAAFGNWLIPVAPALPDVDPNTLPGTSRKFNVAGIISGLVVILLGVLIFAFLLWLRRTREKAAIRHAQEKRDKEHGIPEAAPKKKTNSWRSVVWKKILVKLKYYCCCCIAVYNCVYGCCVYYAPCFKCCFKCWWKYICCRCSCFRCLCCAEEEDEQA